MRSHARIFVMAACLLMAAPLSGCAHDSHDATGPMVYVTGDAYTLRFWVVGEEPEVVTYELGYADPRIGTGPHDPQEETPGDESPLIFRTGPKTEGREGVIPEGRLTPLGAVRWDPTAGILTSAANDGALTRWTVDESRIEGARLIREEIAPAFIENKARQDVGRVVEETHVSLPARTIATGETFEPAPAGRMLGRSARAHRE